MFGLYCAAQDRVFRLILQCYFICNIYSFYYVLVVDNLNDLKVFSTSGTEAQVQEMPLFGYKEKYGKFRYVRLGLMIHIMFYTRCKIITYYIIYVCYKMHVEMLAPFCV